MTLELLNLAVVLLQKSAMMAESLDLALVLLQGGEEAEQGNAPGGPGWAPWRLIAGFVLILIIVGGAWLFTYWISKDE